MRRRRRGDGGAVVVEAAFAIPILFLFVAGLVDIGMWTFNSNQAANAARDGARVGILGYESADVAGSADQQAIIDAIAAHVPGRTIGADDVTVTCVDPDGNAVSGGCAGADPEVDRIRVSVSWEWDLVTPIADLLGVESGEATGTATMVLVGLPLPAASSASTTSTTATTSPASTSSTTAPTTTAPTTTTTTTPCAASGLSVSSAQAKNGGGLTSNLTISFSTNGAADCSALQVQLQAPGGGTADHACGCGTSPDHTWTYGKNDDHFWSEGTAYVRVLDGASVIAQIPFTVE